MDLHPQMKLYPIFTALRCGTWWTRYFFWYCYLLRTGQDIVPIKEGKQDWPPIDKDIVNHFHVTHGAAPGFKGVRHPLKNDWKQLKYTIEGYNYAESLVAKREKFYHPRIETNPGWVYIYRNPLDHFVSMFHHLENHIHGPLMEYYDENGSIQNCTTPFEFAKHHGIQSFMKQYLTHKWSKEKFNDKVLMMSYESMKRDTHVPFKKIVDFFKINEYFPEDIMEKALELCSLDQMKKLEKKMGHSIGYDQTKKGSQHVRDGSIGKWKDYFSDEQVKYIDNAFNAFDLSLSDFELE